MCELSLASIGCPTKYVPLNFYTCSSSSLNWQWNFNFKRNLGDREIHDHASLLELLYNVDIDGMKEDKRLWSLKASGDHSSKSYPNWLINGVSLADFLLSKTIQKASILPKIQVIL